MTRYLDEFTGIPEHMPYPRFLAQTKISYTAKVIYTMFLDRYTLSLKNGWHDDEGHVYIVYPVEHAAKELGRAKSVVQSAVNELVREGLIVTRRHGFSMPNRIYLLIPEGTKMVKNGAEKRSAGSKVHFEAERKDDWQDWLELHQAHTAGKPDEPENRTNDSTPEKQSDASPEKPENQSCEDRKTGTLTAGKPDVTEPENRCSQDRKSGVQKSGEPVPNHININHSIFNNINNNNKRAYGEYENVFLTEEEYSTLRTPDPVKFDEILQFLTKYAHDCPEVLEKPENKDHAEVMMRLIG